MNDSKTASKRDIKKDVKKDIKNDTPKDVKRTKHYILKAVLAVVVAAIIACVIYVLTPYKADKSVAVYFQGISASGASEASETAEGSETAEDSETAEGSETAQAKEYQEVTVTALDKGLIVAQPKEPIAGLIFYPGGRVKYDAYVPLMYEFARRGLTCVIVEMPLNFAVFDIDAAEGIKEQFPEINSWYIGGHSLGGAMAAYYVADHADEYDGLLLLGAYSTEDLTETGLNVYLAYGTQDGVINRKNYAKGLENLPAGSSELIIVGGCHAYFGNYGKQAGDGHPYITREEQMKYTADGFIEYILSKA